MDGITLPPGVAMTAASGEFCRDPVTGAFGYLAVTSVPEPGSALLLALGLATLAWQRSSKPLSSQGQARR